MVRNVASGLIISSLLSYLSPRVKLNTTEVEAALFEYNYSTLCSFECVRLVSFRQITDTSSCHVCYTYMHSSFTQKNKLGQTSKPNLPEICSLVKKVHIITLLT